MYKRIVLALTLLLMTSQVFGGSANVNVTIKIPEDSQPARLYNFESKTYTILRFPGTLTRKECLNYLPKIDGVTQLLDQFISQGHSPYKSLRLVYFKLNDLRER